MIEVESNKNEYHEYWYIKGTDIHHNDDGPAVTEYYTIDKNRLWYKEWYQHGKIHREDGPAVIIYSFNRNVFSRSWWQNGKMHREDGPAYLKYDKDGNLETWKYFINHNNITEWAKENITDPFNPTDEEKVLMLLTFG